MRRRPTTPIIALALLVLGSVVSARAACPSTVAFAFLDLDGNLCHDPTDSGDVGPQLVDPNMPFAPAAGSLVCSAGVRVYGLSTTSDGFSWTLPGSVVIDCPVRIQRVEDGVARAGLRIDAGGRVVVNALLRAPSSFELIGVDGVDVNAGLALYGVGLKATGGDVAVADRVNLRCTADVWASGDVRFGYRAAAAGAAIEAGGSVVLGDAVRLKAKYYAPVSVRASADVLIGDGVLVSTRESEIEIAADPIVGVLDADRLTASGRVVSLGGGSVRLGPRTLLRARLAKFFAFEEGTVHVTADATIDADGVGIDAARDVHLTVSTGSLLKFTNGRVKGSGTYTATFSTAAGGTCDVTGTTFDGIAPVFVGCTPIGP